MTASVDDSEVDAARSDAASIDSVGLAAFDGANVRAARVPCARSRSRWHGKLTGATGLRVAATVLFVLLSADVAGAAPVHDRFGIERHSGESAWEAAASFEFACLAAGIPVRSVRPVQEFRFRGLDFVRLGIEGDEPHRCLPFIPPSRISVDGSFRWFDGFDGGLLIGDLRKLQAPEGEVAESASMAVRGAASPTGEADSERTSPDQTAGPGGKDSLPESPPEAPLDAEEDRVPDSIWYRTDSDSLIPSPVAESELVSELALGLMNAVSRFEALDHGRQWATLHALKLRTGSSISVAMERVATSKALWSVRRAALQSLDPALSWETVITATGDSEAGIRLSALGTAVLVADRAVPGLEARAGEALELVLRALESEPHWAVRRGLLLSLSLRQARKLEDVLRRVMWDDAIPVVRATALEVLHQAGELSRGDALKLAADPVVVVRASGVAALVERMAERDAPVLWQELVGNSRPVSHAAVGLLWRIDDPTLAPLLWPLYSREAELLDADPQFLESVLAYIGRHPAPGVVRHLSRRLEGNLSPVERRLLGRTLAKLDPKETERLFGADLDSADPVLRSIAADVLPNSSSIDNRRVEIIDNDPDSDVRASALIGLCRKRGQEPGNLFRRAALLPTALGEEALVAFQNCGQEPLERRRLRTAILDRQTDSLPLRSERRGGALALLACVLLAGSVLFEKLAPRSTTSK